MYEFLVAHQVEIMMYLGIMCTNVVIFVLLMRSIPKKRRRALLGVQACAMVIMYSDCAAYVFRGDPSRLGFWAVRISNFLVYFLIKWNLEMLPIFGILAAILLVLAAGAHTLLKKNAEKYYCEGVK